MPTPAQSPAPSQPRGRLVRCLGPAKTEHSFYSAAPSTNRVCPRCEQRVRDVCRTYARAALTSAPEWSEE